MHPTMAALRIDSSEILPEEVTELAATSNHRVDVLEQSKRNIDSMPAEAISEAASPLEVFVKGNKSSEQFEKGLADTALNGSIDGNDRINELKNEIHPLLGRDRWSDSGFSKITADKWEQLEPSVTLNQGSNITTAKIRKDSSTESSYLDMTSSVSATDDVVDRILDKITEMIKSKFKHLEHGHPAKFSI
ncbi:uncharacterized protein CC84DRAFT_1232577 [Paraphaeosphaeria sporulosa]|uniref:Uncharacterized protein n=1 Tax=Paraphaeosphaeria sporulosa TaxID=1460663 RepID=A0A177BXH5_9PLEO|nr:uncharacterized protein CC84DRAFT_1232577 [Paraphaeosphaeria sporulosa]OAF99217.1 hypothetical protein CC84DRAFT_1232577 [Paraphaeosphaeria sporulosa]